MLEFLGYLATTARRLLRTSNSVYVGNGEILAKSLFGGVIYLDADDVSLTPSIAFSGLWEPGIARAFARHLKPGQTVVDVGANCGYYSLLAGRRVGPTGRVFSLEPNPRLARLVQKTFRANALHERATVIEGAASDAAGVIDLGVPAQFLGSASFLVQQEGRSEDVEVIRAEARPLGDWLPDGRVDVLKIDAEGAEPLIWKGAEPVIAANPGIVIFMEFAPPMIRHTLPPAEFLAQLRGAGFGIRTVHHLTGATRAATDAELLSQPWCELLLKR